MATMFFIVDKIYVFLTTSIHEIVVGSRRREQHGQISALIFHLLQHWFSCLNPKEVFLGPGGDFCSSTMQPPK
jgi:hypothetical protein